MITTDPNDLDKAMDDLDAKEGGICGLLLLGLAAGIVILLLKLAIGN